RNDLPLMRVAWTTRHGSSAGGTVQAPGPRPGVLMWAAGAGRPDEEVLTRPPPGGVSPDPDAAGGAPGGRVGAGPVERPVERVEPLPPGGAEPGGRGGALAGPPDQVHAAVLGVAHGQVGDLVAGEIPYRQPDPVLGVGQARVALPARVR